MAVRVTDAEARDVQVTVTWSYPDSVQNLKGFRLYRNNQKIMGLSGEDTCFVDDPLARDLNCQFALGAEVVSFTLTAYDENSSESPPSEACQYDPNTNKYMGSCMGPHIQVINF